jgi:hypothetical protein
LLCSIVLPACETERPQPAPAVRINAAQKSAQDDEIEFEGLKGPRPKIVDETVTNERRRRIEAKVSKAQGFLVAQELAAGLQQDLEVTTEEEALEKFDRQAEGRWVLFSGPINEMTAEGFWSRSTEFGVTAPSW